MLGRRWRLKSCPYKCCSVSERDGFHKVVRRLKRREQRIVRRLIDEGQYDQI